MTNETTLLALLESREAEANAKAEWIAEWCEHHAATLLAAQLELIIRRQQREREAWTNKEVVVMLKILMLLSKSVAVKLRPSID